MKELFDRHQAKLTDAEDRKVWSAMHDATRRGRRWTRWGLPAFVTTAAALAIVVAVVHQDSVQERAAGKAQEFRVRTPQEPLTAGNQATGDKTVTGDMTAGNQATGDKMDTGNRAATSAERTRKAEAAKPAPATLDQDARTDRAARDVRGRAEPAAAEEAAPMAAASGKAARPTVQAQADRGTIRGRVTARDGTPLVFANVVLLGTNLGTMTDSTGAFVIKGLPGGDYTLKVSYLGYEPEQRQLAMTGGTTETLDFAMNEAVVATMDKVTVEASQDYIRRDQSATRHPVGDAERLPVDTFAGAEALKPGVVQQSGKLHFRGGRSGEVQYQIDGIPVSDPLQGRKPGERAKDESDSGARSFIAPRSAPADAVAPPPGPPIPVGGSAPVNGRVVDAMFFEHYGVNPFVDPEDDRFATFAVDVDNASFSLARAYLLDRNLLPPKDAIRVEEFVNAFDHRYAPPQGDVASRDWGASEHGTFAIHLEASPSPFGKDLVLMRVGLKGREIAERDRKPVALTFVIDVSGSMGREDRLGLVKRSLHLLLDRLDAQDDVSLVVYGTNARVLLQPTSLESRWNIEQAIDRLAPEGATNAEAGLRAGYALAERNYRKGAVNRVILCSDGVANVGRTGAEPILKEIKRLAGEGIYLTAVGFGMGNYNDVLMEKLADQGDGNYYYVDTLDEARKVFVDHLTGTLEVIARQVKIQVEFDPETVRRYRLIGYENRDVADRDFRNDKVDAGEVGAGHEVTALFELKLNRTRRDDVATVRIRYEDPETRRVTEEARSLGTRDIAGRFERTDPSFRMDAAVAEFAEILRHSYWAKDGSLPRVLGVATDASRQLPRSNEVQDLIGMIQTASRLWPDQTPPEWRDAVRPMWEPQEK